MRRAPLEDDGIFAPVSPKAHCWSTICCFRRTAAVFFGTLYPLLLDALDGRRSPSRPSSISLSHRFSLCCLCCCLRALLGWKRADFQAAAERLMAAAGLAFVAMLVAYGFMWDGPWLAPLGMALAVWLVAGAASEIAYRTKLFSAPLAESLGRVRRLPRAAWGMALAHGGLGIAVAGIVGVTAWRAETIVALAPGESAELAGYTLTLEAVGMRDGPNQRATGIVRIDRGERFVARLMPEKRRFPAERQEKTEAGIHTNWISDIYVVLGDVAGEGKWVVRAYRNALAPWIWIGGMIMTLGGAISLTDRRLRVGAPVKAKIHAGARPAAQK